jgi:hypothetical protein
MMRALIRLPLLFAAAPALATGGWSSRSAAPEDLPLDIVTGGGGIAMATLRDCIRTLRTGRELRLHQ